MVGRATTPSQVLVVLLKMKNIDAGDRQFYRGSDSSGKKRKAKMADSSLARNSLNLPLLEEGVQ